MIERTVHGRVICIIPARGGSKGIPHKNARLLAGKPLIAYTIQAARSAKYIDDIYVSTDDETIARISREYGAKVIDRPAEISGDEATSEAALIHAIGHIEQAGVIIDIVAFLQCTSPLRTSEDIDQALSEMRGDGADSLLSVTRSHKFIWELKDGVATSLNYDYKNRPRRQDMPPQYAENGSIYLFKPWVLREMHNRLGGRVAIFVMRDDQELDIDTEEDWLYAERTLN